MTEVLVCVECTGGNGDIDHDDGVEVLNINLACDMEMYL